MSSHKILDAADHKGSHDATAGSPQARLGRGAALATTACAAVAGTVWTAMLAQPAAAVGWTPMEILAPTGGSVATHTGRNVALIVVGVLVLAAIVFLILFFARRHKDDDQAPATAQPTAAPTLSSQVAATQTPSEQTAAAPAEPAPAEQEPAEQEPAEQEPAEQEPAEQEPTEAATPEPDADQGPSSAQPDERA